MKVNSLYRIADLYAGTVLAGGEVVERVLIDADDGAAAVVFTDGSILDAYAAQKVLVKEIP